MDPQTSSQGAASAAGPELSRAEQRALRTTLAPFQAPSVSRSLAQLGLNLAAYAAIVTSMYAALHVSLWLALALSVPAAGFVVRLFIIQHDCGHGSYFKRNDLNGWVGSLCSMATFTPFAVWRRQHAGHHTIWNNLDRRHSGADIYSTCLTVEEFAALSRRRRLFYRLSRNPILMHCILPPFVFLVLYRLPFDTPRAWRHERRGIHLTNLALAAMLCALVWLLGWKAVLAVQLPIMILASIAGVWLFSVQHRFEDSEWMHKEQWNFARAALHGSSYLRLPRVLQWFTGNIGFHHIHHLLPRVPNYRLQAAHEALLAQSVTARTLSFFDGLRAPSFALWDSENGRMVPFPKRKKAVLS